MVDNHFYEEHQGEPQIELICEKEQDADKWIIWENYVDQIIRLIEPVKKGWIGSEYYNKMYLSLFEDSEWEVSDLNSALDQFKSIDLKQLDEKLQELVVLFCSVLEKSIKASYKVIIKKI